MVRNGSLQSSLVHLLNEGSIAVPVILMTEYKQIGLSEREVVLLIHLMIFQEKAQNFFPTMNQLEQRMSLQTEEIVSSLQRLVQGGFVGIDEVVDDHGVRSERYSVTPLLQQLVASFIERKSKEQAVGEDQYESLFLQFEQEFGRALSPFECESLARWLDEDHYSEELIQVALREAVFNGKLNFKYIDRILLDWERNQIRTAEEASEYARRFHQKGSLYASTESKQVSDPKSSTFSFYNWVNQE